MSDVTVGLLHPGEMGAAVGQCLAAGGHEVLWVPQGRSPATAARAAEAKLTGAAGLADLVRRADIIMSVCPPHGALDIARQVARAGFGGLYLDANAIAPATAREVAGIVEAGIVEARIVEGSTVEGRGVEGGGATFVDGGIIGTPPVEPGFIRLFLSGARAQEVRALFDGTPVTTHLVERGAGGGRPAGEIGAASAVKMAYASWTKGSAAMLLAARALARAEGVEDALLAEWEQSQPGLVQRWDRAATAAAKKGWRWVAEMEEIAASMAADDLPAGFHQAAADIYRDPPTG